MSMFVNLHKEKINKTSKQTSYETVKLGEAKRK